MAASLGATCAALADPRPAKSARRRPISSARTKKWSCAASRTRCAQSDEQRRAIETEIDSVRADRARLSAALIDTTAKVQDTERERRRGDRQIGEPQRHGRWALALA